MPEGGERARAEPATGRRVAAPRYSEYPPPGAALFRALRSSGQGETLVLEENAFLAKSLENGVTSGLSAGDRAAYYAPYPDPLSRRPLLQWTRELPIDGEPADVLAVVEQNALWVEQSAGTPKLILTFEGAPLSRAARTARWKQEPPPGLTVVALGKAGHHAPEDAPHAISASLRAWLTAAAQPVW